MLELIIDMVMKNPNCLSETEIVDHLVTFVGTVGSLNFKTALEMLNLCVFFKESGHTVFSDSFHVNATWNAS